MVDPADEGRDFHVDSRDILPPAPEAPGDEAAQLVVPVDVAHQRTSSVALSRGDGFSEGCERKTRKERKNVILNKDEVKGDE